LYNGITFAVFQDAGGAAAIALSFRKVARLPIPAGPRNLRSCGGSLLFPRLLVALYECYNTDSNSAYVIYSYTGSSNG
jgi:hypothetical protein